MMHIDMSNKIPPADWCQKADEITKELLNCESKEERKKLIKRKKYVWGELKDWLLSHSYGKCWYSESLDAASRYQVDHFRPINSAKQLDGSEIGGYWWLAFDWNNYRISGSVCNRRKWDHFPLKNVEMATKGPSCVIDSEEHYLLDPTNYYDTLLLTFDEAGKTKPAVNEDTWKYERAIETIKLLNLDYNLLVNKRKKIWSRCFRNIRWVENLPVHIRNTSDIKAKNAFEEVYKETMEELIEMISPSSELSSTAKACLVSNGYEWLVDLIKGQKYEH